MGGARPFRIGFFIDGFTFRKVNDYYLNQHTAKSRICLSGLRNFVLHKVKRHCPKERPIVLEGHYYHASADPYRNGEASEGLKRFEKNLRALGFQTHYPASGVNWHKRGNADLISDMAMFSLFQEIDIAVLVSTQGFYAESARILRQRKIPLILLGWNFNYTNSKTLVRWKTDVSLRERAAEYVAMEKIMDEPSKSKEAADLFVAKKKIEQRARKTAPHISE